MRLIEQDCNGCFELSWVRKDGTLLNRRVDLADPDYGYYLTAAMAMQIVGDNPVIATRRFMVQGLWLAIRLGEELEHGD